MFDAAFLQQLEKLHLSTKKIFAGHMAAKHRSQAKGSGLEFADVREYNPGDDLRQIDWNLYGRVGKLFTRLYHVEQDQSVYVLFDASASMNQDREKLEFAQQTAASIAFIALANLDRVTVLPFGSELTEGARNVRGKKQLFRVFEALQKPTPPGPTDFKKIVHQFLTRFPRAGVVVVISDFLAPDGLAGIEPLALLPAARHETSLLRITSLAEQNPALRGHVTLVDAETGTPQKIQVTSRVITEYKKAFEAYTEGLRAFASKRRLSLAEADTREPFDQFILKSLRTARVVV
jgi:uncharacterized protein (DUF58 family)